MSEEQDNHKPIFSFEESVRAEERERCAKIAETWATWTIHKGYDAEEHAAEEIAEKLRSIE